MAPIPGPPARRPPPSLPAIPGRQTRYGRQPTQLGRPAGSSPATFHTRGPNQGPQAGSPGLRGTSGPAEVDQPEPGSIQDAPTVLALLGETGRLRRFGFPV